MANSNLLNIKIIGTDGCENCHNLKEEIENYYPHITMKYELFKNLGKSERERIREFLNKQNTHLPVILLQDHSIYEKSYQEFLKEAIHI
jgi:glutaredoxin